MSAGFSLVIYFPNCLVVIFPTSFFLTVVPSFSHVWLLATPWTAACQASLSITKSPILLRLMSIESVKPSNHLVSSFCLQSFPELGSSLMNRLFTSGGQSIGASASASVLPMNIQDWFSIGLTGWISLQSKGLSRIFSNTAVQKQQFFSVHLLYGPTLTSIRDY